MSTAARKARKRAGIKFEKPAKVPTPVLDRSWFAALVPGATGTKYEGKLRPRSKKSIEKALEHRTNVQRAARKPKRTLRSLLGD